MLTARRDLAAARRFFKRAITANGAPERVVFDESSANLAGPRAVSAILKVVGAGESVEIRQATYLNNIVERDHRFIKRVAGPMKGSKALHMVVATIVGSRPPT